MKKYVALLSLLFVLPASSYAAYSLGLSDGTNCNTTGADKCVELLGSDTVTYGSLFDRNSDSFAIGYNWNSITARFDFLPHSTSLNFFDGGTWASFDVEFVAFAGTNACSGLTRTQCEALGTVVGCVSYPGGVYSTWTLETCPSSTGPAAPTSYATSTLDGISFSLVYLNALITSLAIVVVVYSLFNLFA